VDRVSATTPEQNVGFLTLASVYPG
jgi:hypothetical protein